MLRLSSSRIRWPPGCRQPYRWSDSSYDTNVAPERGHVEPPTRAPSRRGSRTDSRCGGGNVSQPRATGPAAASQKERPGTPAAGGADRWLERPIPQNRRNRLADPGGRCRGGESCRRVKTVGELRPRPVGPGRADIEPAGRGAANHRERAHPGPSGDRWGYAHVQQRPAAATGHPPGRRGAGCPPAERGQHPLAPVPRWARPDFRRRPLRPGHLHRSGTPGSGRPRGVGGPERGRGSAGAAS